MALESTVKVDGRYQIDDRGFLIRPQDWDEEFVVTMAPKVGITSGLTNEHWKVIRFIRNAFDSLGQVPLIYVTCINNRLHLKDLKRLFPAGYHRGACRLAGVTYRTGYHAFWIGPESPSPTPAEADKVYRTDALGFLVDPDEWDEAFAVHKAAEMKMSASLSDAHWSIIRYLREFFASRGVLPTVYEACEDNNVELDELQRLFPDGYHRGALKLAGLRHR